MCSSIGSLDSNGGGVSIDMSGKGSFQFLNFVEATIITLAMFFAPLNYPCYDNFDVQIAVYKHYFDNSAAELCFKKSVVFQKRQPQRFKR